MNNKGKANTLRIAFEPLKKRFIVVFGGLIAISIVTTILSVVNARLLGEISEKILNKNTVRDAIITFCIILLVKAIISFINSQIQVRYTSSIEYRYKEYTERALLGSTTEWLKKQTEGDLLTKISTNLTQAASYVSTGLLSIISRIISIVVSVIVISIINYKIIVFLLPLMAISILLQMVSGKPLQSKRKAYFDSVGGALSVANDGMTNYSQVKINGLEKWFLNKYDRALINIKKTYIKIFPPMIVFMGISILISIFPLVFLLFYGAFLCTTNQLGISQYITVITLGIPITTVMSALSQDVAAMQAMKAALVRLADIWKASNEYKEFEESKAFDFSSQVDDEIDISNMTFGYTENNNIFNDFNLNFKKDKKYIIVGGNGCGKSTLINLLTASYIPKQGQIHYAFDKENLNINEFRDRISVVEQDSYLFEDSVINNIFINNKNANTEYMNEWYKNSFISEIIDKLPKGKDTLVIEGGSNLSGGQKRCVNIARGLVKESDVIILDEPTANIDHYTAEIVSKEIVRMSEIYKRTIIIITHDEKLINIGQDVQKIQLDKLVRGMEESAI